MQPSLSDYERVLKKKPRPCDCHSWSSFIGTVELALSGCFVRNPVVKAPRIERLLLVVLWVQSLEEVDRLDYQLCNSSD